jgi:hypothetical protein
VISLDRRKVCLLISVEVNAGENAPDDTGEPIAAIILILALH